MADPAGVYFTVLGLGESCTAVEGNHDRWLASYIRSYCPLSENARKRFQPYFYESFALLRERLTDSQLSELAEWIILRMPLQAQLTLDGKRYLFAHAMTSPPQIERSDDYYLMAGLLSGDGEDFYEDFLSQGIPGYIPFCGHQHTTGFAPYP